MNSGQGSRRYPAINGPTVSMAEDLLYQRECTFAVDPSVESLIEKATEAGWERQHVIVGIIFAAARQLDDQETCRRLIRLAEGEGVH